MTTIKSFYFFLFPIFSVFSFSHKHNLHPTHPTLATMRAAVSESINTPHRAFKTFRRPRSVMPSHPPHHFLISEASKQSRAESIGGSASSPAGSAPPAGFACWLGRLAPLLLLDGSGGVDALRAGKPACLRPLAFGSVAAGGASFPHAPLARFFPFPTGRQKHGKEKSNKGKK